MTARRTPLEVVGEVQAQLGNNTFLITADKGTITVDVPGLRAGFSALRGSARGTQRARAIARADDLLRLADLRLQINLARAKVAALGAGVRPGLLSKLLGLGPIEVRPSALIRSLLRG